MHLIQKGKAMLFKMLLCAVSSFLVACSLQAQAPKVKSVEQPVVLEDVWIIGGDTVGQWEGLLPLVNPPYRRSRAFPGQNLTLAVWSKGDGRDELLRAGLYSFTVEYEGAKVSFKDLRPTQVRQVKNHGADFVKYILSSAQIKQDVNGAMSVASVALFDLKWTIPPAAKDGLAKVQGKVAFRDGRLTAFKDEDLPVWSFDRISNEGGFKDMKEAGDWMMTYYQHPEPSRLRYFLRLAKDEPRTYQPAVMDFLVAVLKEDPAAAMDTMGRLEEEALPVRNFGYYLLRQAGYDISGPLARLRPEEREGFEAGVAGFPPLPDPYDLTPNVADPMGVTTRMDMLWSRFLTTGRQEPVKAIATILRWREDGMAFLAMRKAGKKIDGLSLEILRALAYSASGWSLGSFFRNHPLVADFIDAWKADLSTPMVIKEELGTLITNEAFKMK